jgi:glucose-induced degradation protein 8
VLDTNAPLYFRLQQQRLIELVRQGHTDAALSFAQEELAPRGEEHPQLLDELERTVALLAFADQTPGALAPLLDMAQRQRLASELNAAILASQAQEKDAKLPGLLRMLLWAQTLLEDKVRYPRISNLVTAEGDTPMAEPAAPSRTMSSSSPPPPPH